MRYVELVIQGVRRFTASQRLNIAAPRVWLAANSAGGKTTAAQLIRASLDTDYYEAIQKTLTPWRPTQDACRFALIVERGSQRYRLSHDVALGAAVGAAFNANAQRFEAVANDGDAIRDLLTDKLDFPDPGDWASVFIWSDGGGASGAAATPAQRASNDAAPINEGALRERLEELMVERQLMTGMDKVQSEVDDLQNRSFELEDEQRKAREQLAELDRLKQQLEKTALLENLDQATLSRAKNDKTEQRREEDQRIKLEDAAEAAAAAYNTAAALPMWHKDKLFLALCCFIVLALAIPYATEKYGWGVLGIAGIFIGLPFMFFKYKKLTDQVADLKKKKDEAQQNFERTVAENEKRRQTINDLIKKLGVLDAKDIAKLAEERAALVKKANGLEQAIEQQGLKARVGAIDAELKAMRQRSEKLSQQLQEASSGQRDVRDIDEEIAHLQRQLNRAGKGQKVSAAPIVTVGGAPSLSPGERLAAIVAAGARIARREPSDLATMISPVVTKIVNAVFPDTFKSVQINAEGGAAFTRADEIDAMDEREVYPALLTVAAAAVQIATAKVAAQVRAFPIVWDEPFTQLDDATLSRLAGVAVKAAGDVQMIVLSGRKALGGAFGEPLKLG